MLKKFTRIGLATMLGASLLVGAGAVIPAQAKTVNACVKKSTGEVRILSGKKKCKKGWKKISWNQKGKAGPQGNQGAQGPNLSVIDGNGKTVGRFLGLFPEGPTLIFVEIDGGSYMFLPNGTLFSIGGGSPSFKTSTCDGTAYLQSSSAQTTQFITGSAGGPSRLVYRPIQPTFGPASAWKFSTTTEAVNALPMWELNDTGACVPDPPNFTGTLVTLERVTAPLDVPGPLKIG